MLRIIRTPEKSNGFGNEDFRSVFINVAQAISVIVSFVVAKSNRGHTPQELQFDYFHNPLPTSRYTGGLSHSVMSLGTTA